MSIWRLDSFRKVISKFKTIPSRHIKIDILFLYLLSLFSFLAHLEMILIVIVLLKFPVCIIHNFIYAVRLSLLWDHGLWLWFLRIGETESLSNQLSTCLFLTWFLSLIPASFISCHELEETTDLLHDQSVVSWNCVSKQPLRWWCIMFIVLWYFYQMELIF